ncbi:MAG: Ig-like domain-containing protein, partial [Thermoplasmata archaeon]|nr:Ig-like domain-containing protein [Thermoplasmata archaeon]
MKTELFMESGLGRRMLAIMLAVIMVAMVASPMVTVAKTNTQEPLSEELTNVAGDIPAIEDTESTGNAVWAPDRTDEVQREQKPSMWGGSTVYSAPNPPTPNALIPIFFDDMESGVNGWTVSGLWHMVDNESGAAPQWNLSYSGNWSWWYGQDSTGDYNTGAANTGRLESPSIDLTGYASATLTFMEWFETDSPIFQDKRWLQYNNGGGWVDIEQLPDDSPNTWINRSIDLTPYCGQSIQLGFNFSANGFLNNYQGWYIDDVLVGYYPYDVEMSPQFQANYGYQAQDVSYTMTINNTGDNNDTYDLSAASIWPVTFWDMANTTQIYNISVDIKNSTQFIVRVSIPLLANDGDHDFANIIATSQNDTSASCTVDVLTGVPVTPPWFDDLESGGSQYVNRTFAPGTEWELGNASSFAEGPGPAHSPDNCWGTNLLSNYTDGAVCELMMPYINLTSAVSANLTFWHWYDIANVDGGRLLVSNDGGETWTQIDPEAGYPGTDINGNSCYNGQSGGWIQAVFNLSGYVNQVILITFRFAADSTTSIANAPGWYIDDLNLSATYPDTAAPTVISTTPADTATGVSVGTNVVVVYNESMNSSVTPTLSDSLGTTYTFAGWSTTTNTNDTATWTHADWPAATTVDPTVSNGQDLAGNVQVTYSWSFTTAAHTATATGPTNTAPSNVAGITITYTNDTGTTSVDLYYTTDGGTSWFLIGNDGSIDGSYAWTIPTDGTYGWMAVGDGESAPTGGEAPEAASYTYDGTQPTVDNTKPANGSVDVPINQDIVITFNETMDTSSVTFTVWPDPGALSVGWSLGDTVLTASHNDFAANTTYWVNITAAKDVAGNNLTGLIYGFNFTTGWVAGATATATGPIGGPSNNGTINITYSWTGNPTEVWLYYTANGGTNWTFAGNDTKVDGDFNWTIPADGTYGWIA